MAGIMHYFVANLQVHKKTSNKLVLYLEQCISIKEKITKIFYKQGSCKVL